MCDPAFRPETVPNMLVVKMVINLLRSLNFDKARYSLLKEKADYLNRWFENWILWA